MSDQIDSSMYVERGANATKIEISQHTLSLIFAIFAFCISCAGGGIAWWTAREYRQVQIQLMYANAIMLREGLVQNGDQVFGPEGNLEYRQHQLKPVK